MFSLGENSFLNCTDFYTNDATAWSHDMDDIQRFGIDLLCCWSGIEEALDRPAAVGGGQLLDYLFVETCRRDMSISLSSGFHHGFWECWDLKAAEEFSRRHINEMDRRYGSCPSFESWYLDYEIYINFGEERPKIVDLYTAITDLCHGRNGKPVVVSPFFMPDVGRGCGDYPYAEPGEYYDFWCEVLSRSHIDILSLQDNGGQHLSIITDEQRRAFSQAVIHACKDTGTTYWGNVEGSELPIESMDDYIARFGFDTSVNDPRVRPYWKKTPLEKLKRKLAIAAPDAAKIMSWGYQEFFRPSGGAENRKNYGEYLEYRDEILGRNV